MARPTNAQLDAAEARGRALMASEPRAASARYDAETGRLVVDLVNGCAYAFPTHMVEDLSGASPDDLSGVEVDGQGFNLHWPALDADLYVPALVAGPLRHKGMDDPRIGACGGSDDLDRQGVGS